MTKMDGRRSLSLEVRDGVRELMTARQLELGDQLPTEAELAAQFRVGRTTVREALKLLEQDGLVAARQGRGRFVLRGHGLERPITRIESVTEMMRALGRPVTNKVLSSELGIAAAEEAAALQVPRDTRVFRVERARVHKKDVVMYSTDVIPVDVVRIPLESIDWTGSLLKLLEAQGYSVTSAQAHIRAVKLPSAVAKRLRVSPTDAWLLMVQTHITDRGIPVWYSYDYHRGDVFSFEVLRRRESQT